MVIGCILWKLGLRFYYVDGRVVKGLNIGFGRFVKVELEFY